MADMTTRKRDALLDFRNTEGTPKQPLQIIAKGIKKRQALIYLSIGEWWSSHKLKYSTTPPTGGWQKG